MKQNKSCGIITFHKANNYGAVLQAYALKTVLARYCDPFLIPHDNSQIAGRHSITPPFPTNKAKLKEFIIKSLIFFPSLKKHRAFNRFRSQHLPESTAEKGDFFITGSDQVWNDVCAGFDKAYFLDFAPAEKRNSYSASFGFHSIPDELKSEYHSLLSEFNHISVREATGQEIIKDLLNRDVPLTLDPTLLLDRDEWKRLFPRPLKESPYLLVYAFKLTKTMVDLANRMAEERGLQIIVLQPVKGFWQKSPFKNATYRNYISPEDWVQYFYNADCIVTNSFHATAFSINFNKNFYVELLPPPAKVNSRMIDALKLFQLEDRYLTEENIKKSPDFKKANEILETERKKSLEYLLGIIKDY